MKEISIELPHITLAGLSFGDVNKPVLLALHGWLDNAASFIPVAKHLSDYHVIAIDWPGHGRSMHRPPEANYLLTDYIYDLYALVQYLKDKYTIDKIDVIAHSLGGIVAALFAGTFPDALNRLVLIESLGPMTAPAEECANNLRKSIEMQYRNRNKRKPVHPSIESAVTARTNASDFSQEMAALLVERAIEPIEGGFTWASDARLRNLSPIRLTEEQVQDLMSAITVPILLLMGEQGLPVLRQWMDKRTSNFSDFTTLSFTGGHHVHMEQPEAIGLAIERFLS